MRDTQWQLVWSLFRSLKDSPASEREAMLRDQTAADGDVADEVRKMLADDEEEAAEAEAQSEIGPYALVAKAGEGGMGTVYEATQAKPLRRTVALKILKPGMDSRRILARFEMERQALAMMDHPNIARVHDAGTAPSGRPYFVMEFVRGVPITRYCDDGGLGVPERLRVFLPVCQAIEHAHQKGIVHRDIKPSNVLVGDSDGRPLPKVIDFGVAKAMSVDEAADSLATQAGALIGTPEYMSPEQASFGVTDIDTRTDIYSLGVLLYELLTGSTPVRSTSGGGDSGAHLSMAEILDRVRHHDPPAPSSRVSRADSSQVKGEIDWIVLKAMEKDRSRRYETASAMARDIQRYLDGEPVEAAPPARTYRLRKFVRKYRAGLAVASLFAAMLVLGTVVSVMQTLRARQAEKVAELDRDRAREAEKAARESEQQARRERDRAVQAEAASERERKAAIAERARADTAATTSGAVSDFLRDDLLGQASVTAQANRNPELANRDLKVREALDRAAAGVGAKFAKQPVVEASVRSTIGSAYADLGILAEARAQHQRALELRERHLGQAHPDTLASRFAVGDMLQAQGKYPEAQKLFEQVRPQTPRSSNGLAMALRGQGKYEEAYAIYRLTLAAQRRTLGPEHPDAMRTLSDLADALRLRNGFTAEGVARAEEAYALRSRVLGPDHPDSIRSLQILALAYHSDAQVKRALPVLEKVLTAQRRLLGGEHPETLDTMISLANTYKNLNRREDAAAMLETTIDQANRTLGRGHSKTMAARGNLAIVYNDQRKFNEAEKLHLENLPVQRATLGSDHPDTVRTLRNLTGVYLSIGRLKDAEALAREVLEIRKRTLGPDVFGTSIAILVLGEVLTRQGDHAQAAEYVEQALRIRRTRLGLEDGETLNSVDTLARIYVRGGQFIKAEALLREAMAAESKVPEGGDRARGKWHLAMAKSLLGASLAGQKRYEEAESLLAGGYEGMVELMKTIPAQERPNVEQAREWLHAMYVACGKPELAARLRK